ncbi:probable serine serine/threonine-protein kinase DDB_G0282963 isoform X1 [Octopus vulgaris]|uniref:Probable serine serine/threonine-protein kinase DDB_G0282963 isoform X1 n=1 Tax=Octopus vulgaris TaxID=6645 RepID=A0AA36AHL1_OCTVU|nr:probable serine serine/threonine-protein kinase DDB_G0282963 isoform X1 [Octopus vulgaris]
MHAVMYNHLTNSCSNSVVDSTNQCHIKIKTEDDKDLGSCNFSPNYKNSSKLLLNGSNSNVDFTMSAKSGGNQTFSTSQESKSCFKESSDVSNQKNFLLDKVLGHSVENLMKFAEILYKCTLCTTLPSILTSRDSFISHVNDQHLTKKQSYKDCQHCNFNFSTEEDLRAHCRFSHGIETSDTELDSPEASPIDEFTNKSGTEISTENQCTISDPNKTMQYRTSRFVMDTVHGKQRQLAPSAPLFGQVNGNSVASSSSSTGTNISVNNNSSNGCANSNSNNKISVNSVKDSVKPEKMTMEENITRLQQLADQILISNTRLHAGGNSSGFHSAMSNPSYTHDFGKYTKLIREGGNIVYFCQVCNCKCQARAAFLSHCSSYQHRARVETADRSVSSDQQIQHHHQSQQQQHKQQLTTLPPLPTHSQSLPHPIPPQTNIHSSHQNIQSHHQKQHQQQKQPQQPQQKLSPNFKRESSHCPSNSNGNYVSTKKVSSYSSMPSSLTSSSSSSAYSPTSLLEDSSNNDTNNATTSSSHNSNNCKTDSDDNSVTQPSTQPNSRSHATNIPLGGERLSPVSSDTPKEVSDNELDKETKSQEVTSDGEPNSDRESAPRQRRKRHAPVAVRHQPQLTTSWSDSDSDEEFNSSKNNKKTADNMSLTAGENSSLEKLSCKSKEDKNQVHASSSDQTVNEQSKDFPPLKKTKDTSDRSFTNKQSSSSNNQDVLENQTQFSSMEQTFPQAVDSLGMLSSVVESLLIHPNQSMSTSQSLEKVLGTTIKTEPEDQSENDIGLKGIYRCSFCDFVCYDIRDYEEHFIREHDSDLLDANITDSSGKSVHGEYWKMLKIKEVLPELLVGCAKEQLQEQEELSDSENVTYQPLRDLSQDLEKILQFLPELVFWTGDFDMGISRDEVLQLLGQKIEEPGVQYWGVQCNRAMRFLFPIYFGVDFMKNFTRQIPHTFESDQMMFIKSEPIDDSYEDSSTSHLQGMTLSIFPTSTSSVANPNSQTTSTAMSMDFTTSETNP